MLDAVSNNLHEIGWWPVGYGRLIYVVVRIRLFANLGTPTYYVVPGQLTRTSTRSIARNNSSFSSKSTRIGYL